MNSLSLRLVVAAALTAAVSAQDWSARIASQWPGTSVVKATEADFLTFAKLQNGLDGKAGWQAFLTAQRQALGLPTTAGWQPTATVALDVPAPAEALHFEQEPNDTSALANPLLAADHVEANLTAGDADWFAFTLASPAEITLYTNPGPDGVITDTVLELYDSQLNLLAVNDDNRGLLSTIRGIAQPGAYLAKVRHYNPTGTGRYALDLSVSVNSPSVLEAPEPNDSPATATAFAAGRSGDGVIGAAGDLDWWSFTLTQPRTIIAETGAAALGQVLQDSTLTLWDAAGTTQLAFDDDAGAGLFARLVVILQPGTYHLAVGGYLTSQGRYSLRLDATLGQQVQVPEAAEPNGTVLTATQFAPGFLGLGEVLTAGDRDFWLFTVTQNARVSIGTGPGTTGTALLDPTLTLRDLNGAQLAFDDDSGPDLQAQLYVELVQGTYVVDVAAFQALTGTYTLDVVALSGQNAARASYILLGNGCPGSNTLPPQWRVRPFEVPLLGTTLVGEFADAPPSTLVVGFAGLSASITSQGQPLPISLAPIGAPGCRIEVDPFITVVLITNGAGAAQWPLRIPYSTAFISADIFQQGLVMDPTANALGFTTTNFGRGVIGDRL